MLIKNQKNIAHDVFYFLGAILILFVASEVIWPNSVLSYVNINYVFVLWVISWLLLI